METKERHGCVTAWLIFVILINSLSAGVYLVGGEFVEETMPNASSSLIAILIILGIGNIIFAVMLLKWRKLGFWGFLFTSGGAFLINLQLGLGVSQSLFGLVGIAVLWGVLQIKKNDVSAWENLE